MIEQKTYNYYLTRDLQLPPEEREVIMDEVEVNGVRCYIVVPPMEGEPVQRFQLFSEIIVKPTLTEDCSDATNT